MIATPQFRMCDVCRLVDYDTTPKLCNYCGLCDAYICEGCAGNWPRRIKAAFKRRLEPGFSGDVSYADTIDKATKEAP
jgi:hypothetical protein